MLVWGNCRQRLVSAKSNPSAVANANAQLLCSLHFICLLRIVSKRAFRPRWLLPTIRIERVILQRASPLPASTPNRMASVLENGALLRHATQYRCWSATSAKSCLVASANVVRSRARSNGNRTEAQHLPSSSGSALVSQSPTPNAAAGDARTVRPTLRNGESPF